MDRQYGGATGGSASEEALLAVGDRFVAACYSGVTKGVEESQRNGGGGALAALQALLAADVAVSTDHSFYSHRGTGLSALTSRLSADFADFKLLGNEVLLRAADVATGAVWYLIEGHYVTEGLEGHGCQMVRLGLGAAAGTDTAPAGRLQAGASPPPPVDFNITSIEIIGQPTVLDMKSRGLPPAACFPRHLLKPSTSAVPTQNTEASESNYQSGQSVDASAEASRAWLYAIASGAAAAAETLLSEFADPGLQLSDAFGNASVLQPRSAAIPQGAVVSGIPAVVRLMISGKLGNGDPKANANGVACNVRDFECVPAVGWNASFVRWRLLRADGSSAAASELHVFSAGGKLQGVWQFFTPLAAD